MATAVLFGHLDVAALSIAAAVAASQRARCLFPFRRGHACSLAFLTRPVRQFSGPYLPWALAVLARAAALFTHRGPDGAVPAGVLRCSAQSAAYAP